MQCYVVHGILTEEEKDAAVPSPREVKKRNGVWFVEGDIVLSEVLHEPGPTGDIFDVLAASVVVLSPGRRFALLGFGAGGIVAPLRALGSSHAIHAVDLDLQGEELFRRTARYPVGEVNVDQRDANRMAQT